MSNSDQDLDQNQNQGLDQKKGPDKSLDHAKDKDQHPDIDFTELNFIFI
jgi:hypothetical protein